MTRLEELAYQLADSAARSDVECFATRVSEPSVQPVAWDVSALMDVQDYEFVADSMEYLTLRGDALPFRWTPSTCRSLE